MSGLERLKCRITRLSGDSAAPMVIEGVTILSSGRTSEPLCTVNEPVLAIVAQGAKRSVLGDRIFDYHAGQYLVVTLDVPLVSQIVCASSAKPFLGVGVPLEPQLIAQLMLNTGGPTTTRSHDGPAVGSSDADDELVDAVERLLALLENPRDFSVLAPGVRREIHWRLLNGPQAALVRQIGLADSRLALVAHAVAWIKTHYDQVIRMDDLARNVGLSVSSLNRHFRSVTAMSPLQYQKQLRLQKARIALFTAQNDIAEVGYAVGYDSPSQFSREYRRMFGVPPGVDAARLQLVATEERTLAPPND